MKCGGEGATHTRGASGMFAILALSSKDYNALVRLDPLDKGANPRPRLLPRVPRHDAGCVLTGPNAGFALPASAAAVRHFKGDKHGEDHGETCECSARAVASARGRACARSREAR